VRPDAIRAFGTTFAYFGRANADAADSLAMMLRIMGNEVRTARDGQAAVVRAGQKR
jgi:hypothetical protein